MVQYRRRIMAQKPLTWISKAWQHISLTENTSKTKHNPKILEWLAKMGSFNGEHKAWWKEDETPWCGTFVGAILGESNRYVIPSWYRAGDWADSRYMTKLDKPAYGAIAIKKRKGGNHVFFIVGKNSKGQIMGLGGNQGNKVSIIPFSLSDIYAIYWPSMVSNGKPVKSIPLPDRYNLPIVSATGTFGASEA